MVFKEKPASRSDLSGARREFLRISSIILGFMYIFAGFLVSGYTGISYYSRRMPLDEHLLFFQYLNGTPIIPDQEIMGIFGSLSLVTVILLMANGFTILFLLGKYLKGNDGYNIRNGGDAYLNHIPSRVLAKTCLLISISAWLACLTITGIFFIGFPVSDGIWVFCYVWILAILQTFFVWKLQQEYEKGE